MNERIIRNLKLYPKKTVSEVAYLLGLETKEVARAQINYYRTYIPSNSPLWGGPGESVFQSKLNSY